MLIVLILLICDNYVYINKSKRKKNNISSQFLFSRESNLKICQIYKNITNIQWIYVNYCIFKNKRKIQKNPNSTEVVNIIR